MNKFITAIFLIFCSSQIYGQEVYNVGFTIKYEDSPIQGADVTLGTYGIKVSDDNGEVLFTDVLPSDSIFYKVIAEGYRTDTGKVIVTNEHITKEVNLLEKLYHVTFEVLLGTDPISGAKVTFDKYGTRLTSKAGFAVFDSVSSESGLSYTVRTNGYAPFVSGLDVFYQDVFEQIVYSKPSYNVLFIVSANEQPLANADITLSTYGIQTTDKFGYARFINVNQGENIPYSITADGVSAYSGAITVSNKDIEEVVSVTDIKENENTLFNVWPNPTNDKITIGALKEGSIKIINTNGEVVNSIDHYNQQTIIKMSSFVKGLYLIQFTSGKFCQTQKIMVN